MESIIDELLRKITIFLPGCNEWGCMEKYSGSSKIQYYFVHFKGTAFTIFKDTSKVGMFNLDWSVEDSNKMVKSLKEKNGFHPLRLFDEFAKDNFVLLLQRAIHDEILGDYCHGR